MTDRFKLEHIININFTVYDKPSISLMNNATDPNICINIPL